MDVTVERKRSNDRILLQHFQELEVQIGDLCTLAQAPETGLKMLLNVFEKEEWFQAHGWPSLGLSKEEVVATVGENSVVHQSGCWWGVSATDNQKELEISFHSLTEGGHIFFTSSPATLTEFPASSLTKLINWWYTAKRHAAEHFWGSGESSLPLLLIVSVLKARRFITCNPHSKPISQAARIRVSGEVDVKQGKLRLTTDTDWHVDLNELNLSVRESDRQQTCVADVLGTRIIRLEDENLKLLAQRVWTAYQLPPSVPLTSTSQQTFLLSSHKGWHTKPPARFTTNSFAPYAVFPEKDRLSLVNGWSLIHGEDAFFVEVEGIAEVWSQSLDVDRASLTRILSSLLPQPTTPGAGQNIGMPMPKPSPSIQSSPGIQLPVSTPSLPVQLPLLPNPLTGPPSY